MKRRKQALEASRWPDRSSWHIVTGEFPPTVGGVGHHTLLLAHGLAAAGDTVHVWCPSDAERTGHPDGVHIHPDAGRFSGVDLARLSRSMDALPAPRRVVVQWVPHAFGPRALNVRFCLWVLRRAWRGDRVEIVVHEPGLDFSHRSLRLAIVALAHALMAVILVRAASQVWVCAPEWARRWLPYRLGRRVPFTWLPLPANIPVSGDSEAPATIRRRLAPAGGPVVGSFGLFHKGFSMALLDWLPAVLAKDSGRLGLLIGGGSDEFRSLLIRNHPELADQVRAVGTLPASDVSHHLLACDILLQPFPGGVNARRASVLAGLAHGRPVVTTIGPATESFWRESGALALAPDGDSDAALALIERIIADDEERARLGTAGRELYESTFDWQHTIATLRR